MPRSQKTHPDNLFIEAKRLVNQGYSIRKAASELGLPYTTVQNHINGKYKGYFTKFWEECVLKPVDEQIVINYATFMASRGCPLSRLSLRNAAKEIIVSRGGDKRMDPSKGPSERWVTRFLKNHHELRLRVAHPPEHARAIISQDVVDLLYLPAHTSHLLQPQDVGYFHILKQRVAELSLQLGYLGVRTLPRNLFGKILLQAFNQINGATVAAAFKCTGIYPFNKNVVKALLPATKEKSNIEQPSTSVASQQEPVCTENALIKLGIISADLAHILVEPPAPKKPPAAKHATFKHARLMQTNRTADVNNTVREPENEETVSQGSMESDDGICVVCMVGHIEGYIWVGCYTCDKWYHRECLPSSVQTLVDLSLITGSQWVCRFCLEE